MFYVQTTHGHNHDVIMFESLDSAEHDNIDGRVRAKAGAMDCMNFVSVQFDSTKEVGNWVEIDFEFNYVQYFGRF